MSAGSPYSASKSSPGDKGPLIAEAKQEQTKQHLEVKETKEMVSRSLDQGKVENMLDGMAGMKALGPLEGEKALEVKSEDFAAMEAKAAAQSPTQTFAKSFASEPLSRRRSAQAEHPAETKAGPRPWSEGGAPPSLVLRETASGDVDGDESGMEMDEHGGYRM
jgi:hypothetical protein